VTATSEKSAPITILAEIFNVQNTSKILMLGCLVLPNPLLVMESWRIPLLQQLKLLLGETGFYICSVFAVILQKNLIS